MRVCDLGQPGTHCRHQGLERSRTLLEQLAQPCALARAHPRQILERLAEQRHTAAASSSSPPEASSRTTPGQRRTSSAFTAAGGGMERATAVHRGEQPLAGRAPSTSSAPSAPCARR